MTSNTYQVPCIFQQLQKNPASTAAPLKVTVPGSKSITNRALLLATLAEGVSTLRGALFSDDSRHFLKCIQDLGFEAHADESARQITVKGLGGGKPVSMWAAQEPPPAFSQLSWACPQEYTTWMPQSRCAGALWHLS